MPEQTTFALNYDLEIEETVISGILTDPDMLLDYGSIIRRDDFYSRDLGNIYQTILDDWDKNAHIDILSISRSIAEKTEDPEASDKIDVILDNILANRHCSSQMFPIHFRRLRDLSVKREIQKGCLNAIKDNRRKSDEILARLSRDIETCLDLGRLNKSDSVLDVLNSIQEEILTGTLGKNYTNLGFEDLDNIIGGIPPGTMVLVGARPGVGKSALGYNIIMKQVEAGKGCAIFSMEVNAEQVMRNLLSITAKINTINMRRGPIEEEEYVRIKDVTKDIFQNADLYIEDTSHMTVLDLRRQIRYLKKKHNISMAMVDYVQLMSSDERYSSRQEELSAISRGIQTIGLETGVTILAIAQLNRKIEDRVDKKPRMSDLRGSGSLEQDAGLIMFLHREMLDQDADQRLTSVDIVKNKVGPEGKAYLTMTPEYLLFEKNEQTIRMPSVHDSSSEPENNNRMFGYDPFD